MNAVRESGAARAQLQEQVRHAACQLWEQSPPPVAHPWLRAMGVEAYGLRQRAGRLVVPMRDAEGIIWNLQFIGPGGSVRVMQGGRVFGLSHGIGWPVAGVHHIAKDYATAARVHALTGHPAAVAFAGWNMRNVALLLRAKDPRTRFTFWLPPTPRVGAKDHHGLVMSAETAAKAVGGSVATLRGDA